MLKFFLTIAITCIISTKSIAKDDSDFYEDILISQDTKLEETAGRAKTKAGSLLDQQVEYLQLDDAGNFTKPIGHIKRKNNYTRPSIHDFSAKENKYGEGPFGLPWGATYDQIKELGVDLVKTPIKDYPNSFIATNLPKHIPDIAKVYITLGEDNILWRIIGYGNPAQDTPDASKIMQLYQQYQKLLNEKYGNEKQYYTPKISEIEKKTVDEKGKEQIEIEKYEEPIGNKNFLAQLQSGEAVLYSTYENQKVGVVLSVNVDGEGKSYLIIDYTNLQILKEQNKKTLNAL
ncbi:MAG: hypothetical protein J6Y53_04295 [Alphaproteobacteria bacterium]|nr:hypothetical protein [Alphaproteobacteria bacterium]